MWLECVDAAGGDWTRASGYPLEGGSPWEPAEQVSRGRGSWAAEAGVQVGDSEAKAGTRASQASWTSGQSGRMGGSVGAELGGSALPVLPICDF